MFTWGAQGGHEMRLLWKKKAATNVKGTLLKLM